MQSISDLKDSYEKKKQKIEERLEDFKKVWKKSEEVVFAELCFCLLTPQTKAKVCDGVIKEMKKSNTLLNGSSEEIRSELKGVRFRNSKARYIVKARNFFSRDGRIRIKERFNPDDVEEAREWLVDNVKGLGYKEASHFLRNVGFGKDLAILDRHVLKNLKRFGVIEKIPDGLSRKKYSSIEKKMREFSKKVKIPMSHLDLLFWSEETGKIFK